MAVRLDIKKGFKKNMLTVVREIEHYESPSGIKMRQFMFKCDCGENTTCTLNNFLKGTTKSCGCFRNTRSLKHGMKGHPLLAIYKHLKSRSDISNEWSSDVNIFLKDVKEDYSKVFNGSDKLLIYKIDTTSAYSKDNFKFVTQKYINNNKKNNVFITYGGVTKNVTQWADVIGVKPNTLRCRLRRGWSVHRALNKN